jgi:PEP-CTERM motif-containing protein
MNNLSEGFLRTGLSKAIAGALLFVPIFAGCASAASINTSVSCGLSGQGQPATSISSSAICTIGSLGLGPGGGYANATASVTYSVVGNDFNSTVSAAANAVPPGLFQGSTSATADASLSVGLYTAGPVRAGFLEVLTGGNFAGVTGGDGIGTTQWALSPFGVAAGCTGAFCFSDPLLQPFLLGTAFQFNENMDFTELGNELSGPASGFGTTQLTFLFFEADGVTPVQVSEAPEPAAYGLLGIGMLGVVFAGRRYDEKSRPK